MKPILLCALFLVSCSSYGKKQPPASNSNTGFAVVELFTSEGCSSCPAAERVLAQVHDEYRDNVYVLEFHVDYWNYIGWTDVFSSNEYTLRQQEYAKHFQLNSTYTPQAVVNGKNELVGSDNTKLRALINDNLQQKPSGSIKLSAAADNETVAVGYTLSGLKNQLLNIALVQKKAEVNVKRGENSGKKLVHINIVRALKTIDAAQEKGTEKITLPAGLPAAECMVIAYTQQKNTWRVTMAGEAEIK